MRNQRIFWQLFPALLLVVLVALVLVALVAALSLKQSYLATVDDGLRRAVRQLDKQLGPTVQRDDAERLCQLCANAGRASNARITLILPDGQVLCDTQESPARMENHAGRPEFIAAMAGNASSDTRFSQTLEQNLYYLAAPIRRNETVVAVARAAVPLTAIDAGVHRIQDRILLSVGIAALAASILSFFIARRLSRPLEQLRDGAALLAEGRLDHQLAVPDNWEMAGLVDSFTRLARQLEERSHAMGRKGSEQQAVLASMVEGVLAVDSDERVISLNRAAAQLVGGREQDLVGRKLQEVIRNAELRRFASRALQCDEPIEDDVVIHGPSERVLLVRGTALRDGQNGSVGAVIVLNDVTHYRHLENIRRDFVANVSHELKTPIASIKGFVETLLDGALENPDDARRFLRIVAKQADRLNAIIEDLLSLSKIEQSEEAADLPLEPARIRDVLAAAVSDCQSVADERSIAIEVTCPDELTARVNFPLLQQAIANLIDNGVKYSEPGREVRVSARDEGAEIAIAVADRGCGIASEHLPRLFERFYRVDKARSRKVGGTGLGLAIVKHIVQAHHGRISVVSTPGQGSAFTIHLPK